ncbi:MAG: hypothetical protein ACREFE_06415 [Limisphaerales bacterium]
MKQFIFIIILLFVGVVLWLFWKKGLQSPLSPTSFQETNQVSSSFVKTNLIVVTAATNNAISSSTTIQRNETFNALTATNFRQEVQSAAVLPRP